MEAPCPQRVLCEERDVQEKSEKQGETEALLQGRKEALSSEQRMWLPLPSSRCLDLCPLAISSYMAKTLPRHQLLLWTRPQSLAAGSGLVRSVRPHLHRKDQKKHTCLHPL